MSHPAKVWIYDSELKRLEGLETEEKERLTETLLDVAEESYPLHHNRCTKESTYGLLKVKVGSLRAICRYENGILFVLLAGGRENFYSDIELAARRASFC